MSKLSDILTQAFDYFEAYGFEDSSQVSDWMKKIEDALKDSLTPNAELERILKTDFKQKFERVLKKEPIKNHDGVSRFTIQRLSPNLRELLDKRIMAAVNLIKLNRDEMIGSTLRRFAGWVTSIPETERKKFDRAELREKLSEPLRKLPFAERRVMIDQGHKLVSAINATIAEEGGAIAAKWFSHWRQENYDYREPHKERDGLIYMIRNSWAVKQGLVKKGENPWSDEITQPGEEVFCRCKFVYLYSLRQIPESCLTQKGKESLIKVGAAI